MQKFKLMNTDGWVELASNVICRLQVLEGWHPGLLRIHIGLTPPDMDSPYFEVPQGEFFTKTTAAGNLYAYAPHSKKDNPSYISVSEDTGTGGAGEAATGIPTTVSVMDPVFRTETTSGIITGKPNSVTFFTKQGGVTFPINGGARLEVGQSVSFAATLNNRLADIEYVLDPGSVVSIIETLDPVPDAGSIIQIPSFTVVSTDGTIAEGANSVTFFSRSGGTAFPNNGGGRIEFGQSLTFTASIVNTLAAIDYVVDPGGSLLIVEVR